MMIEIESTGFFVRVGESERIRLERGDFIRRVAQKPINMDWVVNAKANEIETSMAEPVITLKLRDGKLVCVEGDLKKFLENTPRPLKKTPGS